MTITSLSILNSPSWPTGRIRGCLSSGRTWYSISSERSMYCGHNFSVELTAVAPMEANTLPKPVSPRSLAPQGTASIFSIMARSRCFLPPANEGTARSSVIMRTSGNLRFISASLDIPCFPFADKAGRAGVRPSLSLARSQLLQFGFGRGQLGRALRGRLKSLRRLHERLWVRAQLLANLRIRLQVLTQCWVRFNVFLVGSQRRILGEGAGDVALVLQE